MNQSIFLLFLTLLIHLPSTIGQPPPDSSKFVRVLSFNILHGATTKGDFDLDVIAKVIQDAKPDLVALQEVDFRTRRAKNYDLTLELASRTELIPLFGRAMPFSGGEYGEGVLSRYSFLQTRNVALPFTPGNEPRAALEILTVLPSGDTIAFVGTHLDHLPDETDRIAQVTHINEVFSQNSYPTILAGDLNATPASTPIRILEKVWTPAYGATGPQPTYPSSKPAKTIDYVMYQSADRWRVIFTEVIADPVASDHCAVLVVLELLSP
ncbi:MAG: endonuclease/exonuclease/phosphatase family protein [Bacteroidota bacterium]